MSLIDACKQKYAGFTWRLAAYVKEKTLAGMEVAILPNQEQIPPNAPNGAVGIGQAIAAFPKTVSERFDRILLNLERATTHLGAPVKIEQGSRPILMSQNAEEVGFVLSSMSELGYLAGYQLAESTGAAPEVCRESLRELLTRGGELSREDGGKAFAFKLHQFIGQGRAVYSTLESAATREFSLEGQAFAGPGRLFAPIKFCRHCGQDFYHIIRSRNGSRFQPHPIGTDISLPMSRVARVALLRPTSWSGKRPCCG
jgi:hypothetical protein